MVVEYALRGAGIALTLLLTTFAIAVLRYYKVGNHADLGGLLAIVMAVVYLGGFLGVMIAAVVLILR